MKGQICHLSRPLAVVAVFSIATLTSLSTQAAASGQLGILDTSGLNPSTGRNWAIGDPYRLAFISSGRVDASNTSFGSLDDIATWNAVAQSFANKSHLDLSGASWKVIGSTKDLDARDNTRTNPASNGLGHPIILIDGSTTIARNYADLWDGRLENTITLTEIRGTRIGDLNIPAYPFTGTKPNGTALDSNEVLRALSPSSKGKIRQGHANHPLGWIDRAPVGLPAADNGSMPIYILSDPLYVIDQIPEASSIWLVGLLGLVLCRRCK